MCVYFEHIRQSIFLRRHTKRQKELIGFRRIIRHFPRRFSVKI